MDCSQVEEMLTFVADEAEWPLAVRRHLSSCPRCRAEAERYRSLASGLAALRSVSVEPPASLAPSLEAIPLQAGRLDAARRNVAAARGHVAAHRAAYLGGIAVVAGAAGATLWRTRARRPAPA